MRAQIIFIYSYTILLIIASVECDINHFIISNEHDLKRFETDYEVEEYEYNEDADDSMEMMDTCGGGGVSDGISGYPFLSPNHGDENDQLNMLEALQYMLNDPNQHMKELHALFKRLSMDPRYGEMMQQLDYAENENSPPSCEVEPFDQFHLVQDPYGYEMEDVFE